MALSQRIRRDCLKLIEILARHGHKTRFAGGCVRDRLLGLEPSDYDLATTARPEVVSTVLVDCGYRVIPTGIDHGTVTVVTKSAPVEITTLRVDLSGDGRRAKIDFVEDFRADGARRDFTINAMFEDADGKIYDYFDGEKHLKAKEIHFVGNPDERICEDYLRIMRFFRFIANFQLQADQSILISIQTLKQGLTQISQERISSEWRKTLEAKDVSHALQLMAATGVYQAIFPKFSSPSPQTIAQLTEFSGAPTAGRFLGRQAVLFLAQKQDWTKQEISELTKKFRLSASDQCCLQFLTVDGRLLNQIQQTQADAMELLDSCHSNCGRGGFESFAAQVWRSFPECFDPLALAYLQRLSSTKEHLRLALMPISGQILIKQLGMTQGPLLGAVLNALKRSFRNEEWHQEAEGLIFAEKFAASGMK